MAYYRTPHDVTALPAWQALQQHRDAMQGFSMREAFAEILWSGREALPVVENGRVLGRVTRAALERRAAGPR